MANTSIIFFSVLAILVCAGFSYILINPFVMSLGAFVSSASSSWLFWIYLPLICLIALLVYVINAAVSSSGYDE